MEDATALRPVALHTSHSQVAVTGHEEEMVINQLLTDILVHASQWVVVASQIAIQPLQGSGDQLLNANTLLPGDSRGETESLDGTADTDSEGSKKEEFYLKTKFYKKGNFEI